MPTYICLMASSGFSTSAVNVRASVQAPFCELSKSSPALS